MKLGSISSLGLGSGLDLQGILDKLRAADETTVTVKKNKVTELETRLSEFNAVNSKLLSMKSHALSLSLSSNFLNRSAAVSNESVLSATALAGAKETTHSIEVTGLATKSSWQSTGVTGSDASIYVPTSQESTTGFADTDTTSVISTNETMTLTLGSGETLQTISVDLTAGMTLDQVVDAINTDNGNGGAATYVTAETFVGSDGNNYLRISSTAGGTGEANRVMVTDAPSDLSFAAPEKIFEYHLGSAGDSVSISVAADTTLADLVDLINDDEENPGITASVIDDGSGTDSYRLVLVADITGEDSRISMDTQLDDLTLSELQGADGASLNARMTIDGVAYQRQTNDGIDDVVQGVTLNLKGVGSSNISVSADTESIQSDITGLIEDFNSLLEEIDANNTYDEETGEWGSLSLTSVPGLKQQVTSWMSSIVDTGGSVKSFFDLGMSIERDGSISMDESVLASALSSNFEDVTKFFVGDEDTGITGIATSLNEQLRDATSSSGSIISAEKSTTQSEIDRLNEDIEKMTERLDLRYENMAQRFVELDLYMSKMQSQADYLTSLIDSFNNSKNE